MRKRIATSTALLATLTTGGVAYAGTTGGDAPVETERVQCNPDQATAGSLAGGLQLCPVDVDPTVNLPVVTDLDLDALTHQ